MCCGPEDNPVIITEEQALFKHSRYFNCAINWKTTKEEENERRINLLGEDVTVFILFTKWLRTGFLSIEPLDKVKSDKKVMTDDQHLLCGAYIFAEKYQEGDFQDAVADALRDRSVDIPGYFTVDLELVWTVFDSTSRLSPLRRLIADQFVWSYGEKWRSNEVYENAHGDFYLHTSLSLARRVNAPFAVAPFSVHGSCAYHIHTQLNETCYREKMLAE